ncbi:MAG: response regulator transcription factor [Armatimonadetes bacterium]|nr:response regulator transcription factor [Armatimonadota bacterium]
MHVLICIGQSFSAKATELLLAQLCPGARITCVPSAEEVPAYLDGDDVVILASLSAAPDGLRVLMRTIAELQQPPGLLVLAPTDTPPNVLLDFVGPGRGLLLDGSHPDLLREALKAVAAGKSFVEPTLAGPMMAAYEEKHGDAEAIRRIDPAGRLPERIRQVVIDTARGFGAKEIGRKVFRSEATVRGYLHEAYKILGIAGRHELVRRYQGDDLPTGQPLAAGALGGEAAYETKDATDASNTPPPSRPRSR